MIIDCQPQESFYDIVADVQENSSFGNILAIMKNCGIFTYANCFINTQLAFLTDIKSLMILEEYVGKDVVFLDELNTSMIFQLDNIIFII